jgi:hypothetical protein
MSLFQFLRQGITVFGDPPPEWGYGGNQADFHDLSPDRIGRKQEWREAASPPLFQEAIYNMLSKIT